MSYHIAVPTAKPKPKPIAPEVPDRLNMREIETGQVVARWRIDCIEIMRDGQGLYEPADDEAKAFLSEALSPKVEESNADA